MLDIMQLIFAFASPLSIFAGMHYTEKNQLTRTERMRVRAIAAMLSALCAAASGIALFVAEGMQFTPSVWLRAVVAGLGAVTSILCYSEYRRDRREYKGLKQACLVKEFDSGAAILCIKNGMRMPDQSVFAFVPEGLELFCTEGLKKIYNHCDLELVLKLEPGLAETILTQFVQRIAAGEKFEAGQTIKGITTVDIKLIQAEPSEKETALRIIFPDANGHWPDDNRCNYVVAQQMHPHEKLWSFSRSTEK